MNNCHRHHYCHDMDSRSQEHKIILITTPMQPLLTSTNDHPQFICELRHFLDEPTPTIKKGDTVHLWGTIPTTHNTAITGTVGKIVKHEKYMVTIQLDQLHWLPNLTLHLRLPVSHLEIPHIVRLKRSLEFFISKEASPPPEIKAIM